MALMAYFHDQDGNELPYSGSVWCWFGSYVDGKNGTVAQVEVRRAPNPHQPRIETMTYEAITHIAEAAMLLTKIGTTPDGGIVIGPRGWELLQAALNDKPLGCAHWPGQKRCGICGMGQ